MVRKARRLWPVVVVLVVIGAGPKEETADPYKEGVAALEKQDFDAAVRHFTEAIRLRPGDGDLYAYRAECYLAKQDFDRAIADWSEVVCHAPEDAEGYANRGLAYRLQHDYDRALVDMTEAIRLSPKTGLLYSNRADTYFEKGEYERGMADINEAIRLSPNDPAFYYNRGTAYGQHKDHEQAVTDLSRAIHLAPDFSLAYYNRGNAYQAQKVYDHALADFREALLRDPANVYACFSLAYLLAACPAEHLRDGKQALEYAKKGCDMTGWRMAGGFQALAAAHAELGQFKEAVDWQKKALQDVEGFPPEERDAMRERLKCYEQGKPYRLP